MKKDCSKWKDLMAKSNDKIPEGHVNAYTRARAAFNKRNGITPSPKKAPSPKDKTDRRASIKALLNELDMDSDFSDTDSDSSHDQHCAAHDGLCRARVPAVRDRGE